MECTGRLKGVAKDWVTGKWIITFEMDGDITAGLDQMRDRSEERRVGKECRSRWSPYH